MFIENGDGQSRVIPLTDFLQLDMRGELITAFELPPFSESHVFRSYKVNEKAKINKTISLIKLRQDKARD